MDAFIKYVPPLSFSKHKGCAGRIGVIGGCFEYTGAPFFAGASILQLGGDLSHIFCSKSAATAIKAYQPEQIVHPCLPDNDDVDSVPSAVNEVINWLPALNSVVIGPGLGRNRAVLDFAEQLISHLKMQTLPVVLDGDALFLVSQKPHLVSGAKHFILTPNVAEYGRILTAVGLPKTANVETLAKALGGTTIFSKGRVDTVSNGERSETFDFAGSPRRVGGQGDITAGAMALFAFWAKDDYISAAAAASEVVRKAACSAFKKKKRSTITSDIINEIHAVLPDSWSVVQD